jgi:CobQ-like glutamine amidotransferase family enzyme
VADAEGRPFGRVQGAAVGNGTPDRAEGWWHGRVLATYLHGPVLAQNPALADLLLGWVVDDLPSLDCPPEIANLRKVRRDALAV